MQSRYQLLLAIVAVFGVLHAVTARPWLGFGLAADSKLTGLQEQLRQNQLRRLKVVDNSPEVVGNKAGSGVICCTDCIIMLRTIRTTVWLDSSLRLSQDVQPAAGYVNRPSGNRLHPDIEVHPRQHVHSKAHGNAAAQISHVSFRP